MLKLAKPKGSIEVWPGFCASVLPRRWADLCQRQDHSTEELSLILPLLLPRPSINGKSRHKKPEFGSFFAVRPAGKLSELQKMEVSVEAGCLSRACCSLHWLSSISERQLASIGQPGIHQHLHCKMLRLRQDAPRQHIEMQGNEYGDGADWAEHFQVMHFSD